jgi:5-methylcytosine-specific restriction endonuclease McrA
VTRAPVLDSRYYKLRRRDGRDCAACGKPISFWLPRDDRMAVTIDHIMPLARGGAQRNMANQQLMHRACNEAKAMRWKEGQGVRAPDPSLRIRARRAACAETEFES